MNNSRLTRRRFVTSSLLAGAATSMLSGSAFAIWQKDWAQQPSAIVALLKQRLPNATLDEQSLHDYAADLVRRVEEGRNNGSAVYRAILKNKSNHQQVEHFIVQDFLLRSDALQTAHLKQPVSYKKG